MLRFNWHVTQVRWNNEVGLKDENNTLNSVLDSDAIKAIAKKLRPKGLKLFAVKEMTNLHIYYFIKKIE
jgi:hypothetical protein